MIRINLTKKKKSKAGLSLKGLDLSQFFSFLKGKSKSVTEQTGESKKFDLKNSPLIKAGLVLTLCYFVNNTLEGYQHDILSKLNQEINKVETEKNNIQAKLNKVKGFESIKKQLEEDEKSIRTKLQVVNRLLENRNAPSKLLLQIAQTIPEEVWLTELKVSEDSVSFAGATPGYSQVSDFLKTLNDSSQFSALNLRGIQENSTLAKDQKFQTFQVDARRR